VGNATFAVGLIRAAGRDLLRHPAYGGPHHGLDDPWILAGLIAAPAVLVLFVLIERRTAEPMFPLALFRSHVFAGATRPALLMSIARGGLQFIADHLASGIWLPLHGYDYAQTPLWAGIYLVPLTVAS